MDTGRLKILSLACLLVACGSISARAADTNVDNLVCDAPFVKALPFASNNFDSLTTEALENPTSEDASMHLRWLRHRVLGERYEKGVGVKPDLQEAIRHYRRAAFVARFGNTTAEADRAGDAIALRRLGEMYRDGIGMPVDRKRAQILLDCAAKLIPAGSLDTAPALRNDADFYRMTWITPSDVPKADPGPLKNEVRRLSLPDDVSEMVWSPDGTQMAVSYENGRYISLVDIRSGRRVWTVEHRRHLTGASSRTLTFSPDGTRLYVEALAESGTRTPDQTATVIAARDGATIRTLTYIKPRYTNAAATAVALSADGRKLVVAPFIYNWLVVYDTQQWTAEPCCEVFDRWRETGKGFHPNRLVIDDVRDRVWWAHAGMLQTARLSDGRLERDMQAFQVNVEAMQLNHRTGDIVVGGSSVVMVSRYPDIPTNPHPEFRHYEDDDHALVRAFDPGTGARTHTYLGGGGSVEGLSVSKDGHLIAATKSRRLGFEPSWLLLWDADTEKLLATRSFGSDDLGEVAFSPDDQQLAYVNGDTIHILRIDR